MDCEVVALVIELEGGWEERLEELLVDVVALVNELDDGWEERLEELLVDVVALVNELDDVWEERLEEFDSITDEEKVDSANDEEIDSLATELVVEIAVEVIVEGKGIAHPVKINAKNGIAKPIHLNVLVILIIKFYLFQFKKKEFSVFFVRLIYPSQDLNIENQVTLIVLPPKVLQGHVASNLVRQ